MQHLTTKALLEPPSRSPSPPPATRLIPTDPRNDARTRRSPSRNLRATATDTFVFSSLPPLPSLGRSPPSHRPLDPIATSPLDPSIALSLVLPPSASLPPHPSAPRHLAPSTPRPPRPHSHHRSRTLPARRPLHSRPLTYPQGGNRTNDHSRTTPHNRQRNKPLRLDICVCVSIILPSKCLPRRTDVVSHTRSSKGREQKKNMVQDSAIRSSS